MVLIESSFFSDFSNKHHEGFVGHSRVGSWTNLGALTTTSDLKNNYGTVRLSFKNESVSTETVKFGSIIGDYVKTGIGTMLNTGAILDAGAMLFEGRPAMKYYPPFFWGGAEVQRYKWEKFMADIAVVMKRRNKEPDEFIRENLFSLYNSSGDYKV